MDIIKHVNDINGFVEAYEEVHETVRAKIEAQPNAGFVMMRAYEVVKDFEKLYNVKLLKTEDSTSPFSGIVYEFDTVDFLTEENMTMCLLKWS